MQLLSNPSNGLHGSGSYRPESHNSDSKRRKTSKKKGGGTSSPKEGNTILTDTTSDSETPQLLNVQDVCEDGDTWLFVANTGDSRAVLVTNDGRAIAMSHVRCLLFFRTLFFEKKTI